MTSPFLKAKEQGYSDEEILDYLSKKNSTYSPKIKSALDQGYQPSEIIDFLSKQKPPEQSKFKSAFQGQPLSEVTRHTLRSGARAGETLLGAPGDITRLPENLAIAATGDPEGKLAKSLKFARKLFIPFDLPSSGELREKITKPLTGQYLEPQSEGEKATDEMVQDFTSMMIPVGGQINAVRSLVTTLGGQAVKQFFKSEGEEFANKAKIGSMLIMAMTRRPTAQNYINGLYHQADQSLPQAARVNSTQLRGELTQMRQNLRRGISTPQKDAVLKTVDEMLARLGRQRTVSVHELVEARRNVGELIRQNPRLANIADAPGLRGAREYGLNRFRTILDEGLNTYGHTNPQWHRAFRDANQANRVMRESEFISRFISKIARDHPIKVASGFASALLGFKALVGVGAGVAGGYGAIKTQQLIQRIVQSPQLRQHYTQLLTNAMRGNATVTAKDLEKLYAEAKKEGVWTDEDEQEFIAQTQGQKEQPKK